MYNTEITDLTFTKKRIYKSIEELHRISEKSKLIQMNDFNVDIFGPLEPVDIKPYNKMEDFKVIDDNPDVYKVMEVVTLTLPIMNSMNLELDRVFLYGRDLEDEWREDIKDEDYKHVNEIPIHWRRLWNDVVRIKGEKRKSKGGYWKLIIDQEEGRPLCDNHINEVIQDSNEYNYGECKICPSDFKKYCQDVTRTLKNYGLPKNME
jgi:hypothetical protein